MTYSIKKPTHRTATALFADVLNESKRSIDIVYMDLSTGDVKTLHGLPVEAYGIMDAASQLKRNLNSI